MIVILSLYKSPIDEECNNYLHSSVICTLIKCSMLNQTDRRYGSCCGVRKVNSMEANSWLNFHQDSQHFGTREGFVVVYWVSLTLPLRLYLVCSVHSRLGTGDLARAPLMVAYCSCLRSINTCIVTSRHRQPVQTTVVWPHGHSFVLSTSSKSRPGLLQPTFRSFDNVNMHTGIDAKDLWEG